MITTRPNLTTLSNCDREPIHAPGNIQPHGFLFVVDPATWTVQGASANVQEHFWRNADAVIGLPIADLLGEGVREQLAALVAGSGAKTRATLVAETVIPNSADPSLWSVIAHGSGELLIVEGELLSGHPAPKVEAEVQGFLAEMNEAESVGELQDLAVRTIRKVSGFDRCLLYQFDADWNGTVVAEDRNDRLPAYMNQRFPASDIPAPARTLYSRNRVRMIPANQFRPVPVVMHSGGKPAASLDLSLSVLRSVSPIHLEYMRNMGTGSSMSVAVLRQGELWGLLSCHSRDSRFVPFATRTVCDILSQIFSAQLVARERAAEAAQRAELGDVLIRLLKGLVKSGGRDWREEDVLALGRSPGAALVDGSGATLFGRTPGSAAVLELAAALRSRQQPLVSWEQAPADFSAHVSLDAGCGLLAISVSPTVAVLWFRPEMIRVIEWGGEPRKAIETAGENRTLHPRKSFEVWKETVGGKSLPWEPAVLAAAREFQRSAAEMVT